MTCHTKENGHGSDQHRQDQGAHLGEASDNRVDVSDIDEEYEEGEPRLDDNKRQRNHSGQPDKYGQANSNGPCQCDRQQCGTSQAHAGHCGEAEDDQSPAHARQGSGATPSHPVRSHIAKAQPSTPEDCAFRSASELLALR